MINRDQRDQYANLLEDLYSGLITNFDYENKATKILSMKPQDIIVSKIYFLLWFTYCDLRKHKINQNDVKPEGKEMINRFICFLKSDIDYCWPNATKSPNIILSILTLGIYTRIFNTKLNKEMELYGDMNFWPFRNEAEMNQAKKQYGNSL